MGEGTASEASAVHLDASQSEMIGVVKTAVGFTLLPKSSSITCLKLQWSIVSSSLLGRIIMLPAALENFHYQLGDIREGIEALVPSRFLPGLLSHAGTLRKLVIDSRGAHSPIRNGPSIDSLAGLRLLERLTIPISLLLESDLIPDVTASRNPIDFLLPSSLLFLRLQIDVQWPGDLQTVLRVTGIPETLSSTGQHLPSLRKITIQSIHFSNDTITGIQENVLAEASRIYPNIAIKFRVCVQVQFWIVSF